MGKIKKFPTNIKKNENIEHQKEVPLKDDVDIEFEYKVYLFLDKLKKYKFLLIFLVFILLASIVGIYFYKKNKENRIAQASSLVFDINEMYSQGDYKKAEELINKVKNEYSDTGFYKLAVAYELLIKKEKDKLKKEDITKFQNLLTNEDLKAYLQEFKGYLDYKNKNYKMALNDLEKIKRTDFNYISTLLLKGIILKKGNDPDYKDILMEVKDLSKDVYFKRLAEDILSIEFKEE